MNDLFRSTFLICLLLTSFSVHPNDLLISEESAALLVQLVRVSQEYDLYNARCRGSSASTKTEDSNRLFLAKYRLTFNQVIARFIGLDDRAERASMERNFLQKLGQMGGCAEAKKKGLKRDLDNDYRQLTDRISNLP